MMDGHIWFVGWYDGGDYHEIKITQKEVDNCGTAGCGLNPFYIISAVNMGTKLYTI